MMNQEDTHKKCVKHRTSTDEKASKPMRNRRNMTQSKPRKGDRGRVLRASWTQQSGAKVMPDCKQSAGRTRQTAWRQVPEASSNGKAAVFPVKRIREEQIKEGVQVEQIEKGCDQFRAVPST